jgi:hypothetical protein
VRGLSGGIFTTRLHTSYNNQSFLSLKIRRRRYQQRSSSYLRGEGLSEQQRNMVGAFIMSPTIAECLEHAHYCEWYAAQINDEGGRKFVLGKAMVWRMLLSIKS